MGLIDESPHYTEILKLMLEDKSDRWISQYLEDKYNETISYGTIHYFRKNNVNIAGLIQQLENQQLIKDGAIDFNNNDYTDDVIEVIDNKIVTNNETDKLIFNKVNNGVNVLNLVRDGIEVFKEANIYHDFFNDNEISLKDKMDIGLKLMRLELDWNKSKDTNININNNLMDIRAFFKEDINWRD